jgi:hypothetical protein
MFRCQQRVRLVVADLGGIEEMSDRSEATMAVVHVKAPVGVSPYAIAAELTRALHSHPKHPMTAELSATHDIIAAPGREQQRHGFVAMLSFSRDEPPKKLRRHVRKVARKALRHRFGNSMAADVRTKMTAAEVAAYWCTVRGTPRRVP